jgi:dihydroorotate dehydrogenase electron transfer subunit
VLKVAGEVLSHKKYGDQYHSLTIVAPEIGEKVRPGQFINIRCGQDRSFILRRPFSVYRVHKRGGWSSTIEVVFDIRGPGTQYLSQARTHASIDVIGPVGRGFLLPKRRAHCLLIGGGIGAAPLFFLADELRNEGHRVDVILGARSARYLLNAIEVRRLASVYHITTEDGSMGEQGRVTDVLEDTVEKCDTEVVYTCGPHPMLAAISSFCAARKLPVQVAVEELMACGYGVCMTCVMPVKNKKKGNNNKDGQEDEVVFARSCTEGPVFNGANVIWDGEVEAVSVDQSELSPAGVPLRQTEAHDTEHEFAPPGN